MLDIVIPAAGLGRRMRSYGPKGLIRLGGETVLSRQLRLLKRRFPGSHVRVVSGFESDRVRRALPQDVETRVNPDYETTNVARSVAIGLEGCVSDCVLVVYGDLVFGPEVLRSLDLSRSSVLVDGREGIRTDEVGVNVVDGEATYFSHGLPCKWAHVAVLAHRERQLFCEVAGEDHRSRHFSFEVFNEVLERGGHFAATVLASPHLVEIDNSRDIERAKKEISRWAP